jgi:hypothetical protein
MSQNIQDLTKNFIARLEEAVTGEVRERLSRALVMGGFPGAFPVARTETKAAVTARSDMTKAKRVYRRTAPIQLCPVPRCRERAAPVFHMLCSKHKDTPKKLVAQYRAARRAASKGGR